MTLNELTVRVGATTRDLERGMDRAEEAMDDFADKTQKASISAEESVERVQAAIDNAEDETQELNRTLEQVDGKEVDVDVDVNGKREVDRVPSAIEMASARMSSFSRGLRVLKKRIPTVVAGIGVLGGALVAVTGGMVAATTATAGLTAALTGVVGGMGAVGVAAAAMSKDVKQAFSGLKSAVQEGLLLLTRPIQSVLTDLASRLKSVFAQIAPGLQAIFADIARYIETFADALLPVVDRVMPSFVSVVDAARPVVNSFAQGLASLGPTLTEALGSIERAMPAIQSMVDRLFQSLNKLIPYIVELFAELAKMGEPLVDGLLSSLEWTVTTFGEFAKSITALANFLVREVELSFDHIKAQAKSLATAFRGFIPGSQGSSQDPFSGIRDGAGKAASSVQDLAEKSEAYRNVLRSVIETSGEEPFRLTSAQAQKALPKVQKRIQQLEQQGPTTVHPSVAGTEKAREAQAKAAENYTQKLERLKKVQTALTARAREGEVATSNLSKEMQSFLDKLRNNPLGAFNEELTKTEKVMKSLSDRLEQIKFEGKLAKARGEFDKVEQMESRLRAVGKAYKEIAAAEGKSSQEAQKRLERYRDILEKIREIRKARAMQQTIEAQGPVELQGDQLGDPSKFGLPSPREVIQELDSTLERLRQRAQTAFDKIGAAFRTVLEGAINNAARQFGREFSGAVMSAFSGPDEQRIASLEERRLDLKQELENLDRKEMAHERYAARVRAIHAELAETNKQLARETAGVFERVFRGIGNMVKNVIQQVIAQITAAIAKATALAAIQTALGGGGFFSNLLNFLGGAASGTQVPSLGPGGGLPAAVSSPTPNSPARAGALTVSLQGEFRQRGEDLVATINTTQNANTRRGR